MQHPILRRGEATGGRPADGNHAAGLALSGAIHGGVPGADGFVFASPFAGDSCVATSERSFDRLRATGIAEFVRHAEFPEALDDCDIGLTGPSGGAE